jgi:hypothetical protein
MIPVQLGRSRTVTLNGATVRRIDPPEDAGEGGVWFSVSRYGPQLIAVRDRIGIEEIRTPTVSGRVEILRAVLAALERPTLSQRSDDERVNRLNNNIARQNFIIQDLRDSVRLLQTRVEQVQRVYEDSLRSLEYYSSSMGTSYAPRAARMMADAAARLPSENEARAHAWFWPGAGHPQMGRSGAGWATGGTLALGVAVAGLALPDQVLRETGSAPDDVRIAAVLGGGATYLLFMVLSRASLERTIANARAAFLTRESFLEAATVEVTPEGALKLTVRTGAR